MSDLKGYKGKSFEFLNRNKIEIGDSIKIIAELAYTGILMPRYETSEDSHIVLKLKSGYNIGIELEKIESIKKISSAEITVKKENLKEDNSELPKVLISKPNFVCQISSQTKIDANIAIKKDKFSGVAVEGIPK